jgi:hypothetical protein
VDGFLKGVSEQDAPFAHIVIEITVAGLSDPVKVTLGELDLVTIVGLARGSTVQKLQNAVR